MLKVTAVRFHTAMQTFFRLINSVVDNGLLHIGPRSNQTRVRYTNIQGGPAKVRPTYIFDGNI